MLLNPTTELKKLHKIKKLFVNRTEMNLQVPHTKCFTGNPDSKISGHL